MQRPINKQEENLKERISRQIAAKHSPFKSFCWAFNGVVYTFRTQRNFRIQLLIAMLTTFAAFILRINRTEWSIIILTILTVLAGEMINTAVEYLVDLYEQKYNRIAGLAKDISAGFVLILALNALLQALLVFTPYISALINPV